MHQFILAFSYPDVFGSFPNAIIIIIKFEIVFDALGWEKNLLNVPLNVSTVYKPQRKR